ncbi:MAG: OmpH family outer membrane protein [Tannerella sp.]|jgi:outer membrane protein|nr:OmpH family outer membrane protein [Tannerella sp.]
MKEKLHYAIETALFVAVVILFILQFSGNKKLSDTNAVVSGDGTTSENVMPIAYIDVDSLMSNYTYSIDLNEQMTKKFENSRANLTEKTRKLQSEVADFQRKYETNSFLSRERAESEYQRITKKQEDLQKLEVQLSQELTDEQFRMNENLRKTIITQLREFNKGKGYQLVYGKMNDNILYADDAYNITAEVIEYLNRQYASSPAAKPGE